MRGLLPQGQGQSYKLLAVVVCGTVNKLGKETMVQNDCASQKYHCNSLSAPHVDNLQR